MLGGLCIKKKRAWAIPVDGGFVKMCVQVWQVQWAVCEPGLGRLAFSCRFCPDVTGSSHVLFQ